MDCSFDKHVEDKRNIYTQLTVMNTKTCSAAFMCIGFCHCNVLKVCSSNLHKCVRIDLNIVFAELDLALQTGSFAVVK